LYNGLDYWTFDSSTFSLLVQSLNIYTLFIQLA
jgi:hypothetical protein